MSSSSTTGITTTTTTTTNISRNAHHNNVRRQCQQRLPTVVGSLTLGAIIAAVSQWILQYVVYDVYHGSINHLLFHHSTGSNDDEVVLSIWKVVCFSIAWSLLTCIIVFLGMMTFMSLYESIVQQQRRRTYDDVVVVASSTSSKRLLADDATTTVNDVESTDDDDDEHDTIIFQMEISYVIGAIMAIILLWAVYDFGIVEYHHYSPTSATTPISLRYLFPYSASPLVMALMTTGITVLILMIIATLFRIVVRHMLYSNNNNNKASTKTMDIEDGMNVGNTGRLSTVLCMVVPSPSPTEWLVYSIASTVGLLVGIGTQMILSFMLWSNVHQIPFVIQSNWTIAVFSFGWSSITVLITALACSVLRAMIVHVILPTTTTTRSSSFHTTATTTTTAIGLLIVRMEAMYIGWTLTGICIGWIALDVLHDMTSQIYISIALFLLSLSSFACILYFFPEEEADDGTNDDDDIDSAQHALNEPLLLLCTSSSSTSSSSSDDEVA